MTLLFLIAVTSRRLPQIAKLVETIRYKDFEVTIRERLEEIEMLPAAASAISGTSPSPPLPDKILKLAQIDTGIAVVAIWTEVESAMTSLIQHNGLIRFTNPVKFADQLVSLGKLSPDEVRMLQNLREVRNASVHAHGEGKPTLAEVSEYQRYAEGFIAKLRKIKGDPGYIDPPSA